MILDGIWTSLSKGCGSISIWLESTPSLKERIPIITLQSFCQGSSVELRTSVIRSTGTWSKTSGTPWFGEVQWSLTPRKWERITNWKMKTLSKSSKRSDSPIKILYVNIYHLSFFNELASIFYNWWLWHDICISILLPWRNILIPKILIRVYLSIFQLFKHPILVK